MKTILLVGAMLCAAEPQDDSGIGKPPAQSATTHDTSLPHKDHTGHKGPTVKVSDVMTKPSSFFGKDVTVSAPVVDVIADQLFVLQARKMTMDAEATLAPGMNGLIVLVPTQMQADIDETDDVQVSGIVRPFIDAEIYFGAIMSAMNEQQVKMLRSRPVLVARTIWDAAGEPLFSPETGGKTAGTLRPDGVLEVMASDIAKNPQAFFGRRVLIKGDVDDVTSPQMFTVDENKLTPTTDVLVINPRPAMPARAKQELTIIGTVRPFNETELARQYEWFKAPEDMVAEYKNGAVVVADSVLDETGRDIVSKGAVRPPALPGKQNR